MTSLGKMIFGFGVLGMCIVALLMILAQQSVTPTTPLNIGNTTSINTTLGNQTTGLLTDTASYGGVALVVVLFILVALIIIGSLAMIAKRSGR
jgi:hypothetical protein